VSTVEEIAAAAKKRLAELDVEAGKLRAIVAAAEGTPAPFVAPPVNPFPFGHPMGFPIVGAQPDFRGWKIDCEPSIPIGMMGGVTIVGLSHPPVDLTVRTTCGCGAQGIFGTQYYGGS